MQSGVAQVVTVASNLATIPLVPGTLRVKADMTFGSFDAAFPTGATYVIVPAMVNRENLVLRVWLKAQAARGATIVSICEGAWTVADAGLFDGQRATSHWHALAGLEKKYPGTTWVRDARYVVDDHRISTTGVAPRFPFQSFWLHRWPADRSPIHSRCVSACHHGISRITPSDFAVTKSMYCQGSF